MKGTGKTILRRAILGNNEGATLVEIIIATVILIAAVVSLTMFAPRAFQSINNVHGRSVATSLASSKIEEIVAHPYSTLPVTPDGPYFSVTSSTGPCDCSNVDFSQPLPSVGMFQSSETFIIGQNTYLRNTCMNYMKQDPAGNWQSNCTVDTGMKQIVTNVSWVAGGRDPQSFTMRSMASSYAPEAPPAVSTAPAASSATITVNVCPANGLMPPSCDNAAINNIANSDVSIYSPTFMTHNSGILVPGTGIVFPVPAGSGYAVRVQKTGYFPFLVVGASVTAGSPITVNAILRDVARYGSNLSGELYAPGTAAAQASPTITKVVAQVTDDGGGSCAADATEAVEIHNPSAFDAVSFGSPGGLAVEFCGCPTGSGLGACATPVCTKIFPTFATMLDPGKHFFVVGTPTGGAPPASWPAADYPTNASLAGFPATEGLIPYKTGGGIRIYYQTVVTDSVRWVGADGSFPSGAWEGSPVPAVSLQPALLNPGLCTAIGTPASKFRMLVRAARRGEIPVPGTVFGPTLAPGDPTGNKQWADDYDTNDNSINFGIWTDTPYPPFHNYAQGFFMSHTGKPAGLYAPGETFFQVNDPVSPGVTVTDLNAGTFRYTSQFLVQGMVGPDSLNSNSFPNTTGNTWRTMAVAGNLSDGTPSFAPPLQGPISSSSTWQVWSDTQTGPTFPAMETPTSTNSVNQPWNPPMPCGAGGNAACDTDALNYAILPGNFGYGTNPDSLTPYYNISWHMGGLSALPTYCWITGKVTDTSGVPIPAVAVEVVAPGFNVPSFEKITDANGVYKILVPAILPLTLQVNSQTRQPDNINTDASHFWNPHFTAATYTTPNLVLAVNPLPPILLTPVAAQVVVGSTVSAPGTGSITGQVTAAENGAGLANVSVELRSSDGYVLQSARTDAGGNYSFTGIQAVSYYTMPVTDLRESAVPYKSSLLTVPSGGTVSANFQIRNVPALVTVTSSIPGTFALIYSSSGVTAPVIAPQRQRAFDGTRQYSAVIPGGSGPGPFSSPPISVPPGLSYSVACWPPPSAGGTYIRSPLAQINGGVSLNPNSSTTVACP